MWDPREIIEATQWGHQPYVYSVAGSCCWHPTAAMGMEQQQEDPGRGHFQRAREDKLRERAKREQD